jgi:signal transduction histidine kinase
MSPINPASPTGAPGTPAQVPGTPAEAPGTPAEAPGTPAEAPGTPAEVPGTPAAAADATSGATRTNPGAARTTERALLASQVLLSAITVATSGAALVDHWVAAGNFWAWNSLTVATAVVVLCCAFASARNRRALRNHLTNANLRLGAAAASASVGDEALRVSELGHATSKRRLSASIALSRMSDKKLRVSVAAGLVGEEALRVSVAKGVEVDAQLQQAVESGLVGDANLSLAIAHGLAGDEKLRVSVAAGLVGEEALRVSIERGVQSAEALRSSVEQGIDAAITTLAVVDSVDAAITLYAPDGHILLTNDTARTLAVLARSGELDPHEFGHDRVTLIPRFDQVLARAARGQLVTRRAYWVGIMSTSQYVKRASGELIGTVVASHDVTPLARTRDEFLETVSHELRTPLTSMIGYLELIEDSLDLDQAGIGVEFDTVKRNTDRLLLLINDLLLTAQGDPPAYREPADVVAVARASFDALTRPAERLGVQLVLADAEPVIAEIDAALIGEAIDKVLSNALKFNRPGGRIELSFRTDGKFAIVRIADTGVGISDDDQKRIFERFYRAPSTRAELTAGVGLGLSAAKLIVDAHHGSITAVSSPGAGTTIEISLPLVSDGAPVG